MGGAVAMATQTMPSCRDVRMVEEEEEERGSPVDWITALLAQLARGSERSLCSPNDQEGLFLMSSCGSLLPREPLNYAIPLQTLT